METPKPAPIERSARNTCDDFPSPIFCPTTCRRVFSFRCSVFSSVCEKRVARLKGVCRRRRKPLSACGVANGWCIEERDSGPPLAAIIFCHPFSVGPRIGQFSVFSVLCTLAGRVHWGTDAFTSASDRCASQALPVLPIISRRRGSSSRRRLRPGRLGGHCHRRGSRRWLFRSGSVSLSC